MNEKLSFSKATLNEIKERSSIEAIIGQDISLKRVGQELLGPCPFEVNKKEKATPFTVNAKKQFYYCFCCKLHGDVFQYLASTRKLSFVEAVRSLAAAVGMRLPEAKDRARDIGK